MITQGQEAEKLFVDAVNQIFGAQVQPAKAGSKRMWSVMLKETDAAAPRSIGLSDPHNNQIILKSCIDALRNTSDPQAELTFNVVRHLTEGGKLVMQSMCVSLSKNAEGEMVFGVYGLDAPLVASMQGMTAIDLNKLNYTDINYTGGTAARHQSVLRGIRGFINGRPFDDAFPVQTYPRFDRNIAGAKPN